MCNIVKKLALLNHQDPPTKQSERGWTKIFLPDDTSLQAFLIHYIDTHDRIKVPNPSPKPSSRLNKMFLTS